MLVVNNYTAAIVLKKKIVQRNHDWDWERKELMLGHILGNLIKSQSVNS
jgi:hypothetical protein